VQTGGAGQPSSVLPVGQALKPEKPAPRRTGRAGKRASAERSRPGPARPVKLLSGGNPQIPKGDGDSPVQAFIAAMPGWKRDVGRRLDALIVRAMPNVKKAVRWNSPFYGLDGQGWLVSFHVLTRSVRLNFFCGASLRPAPPCAGKDPNARWVNIHEGDVIDESQLTAWLQQAATLRGWASFSA
jgi:hypothetical protein